MANVNIKFNGKDFLLSCDDGQEDSLKKLTKFLFKKYKRLMFEQYIGGQEVQVAIINNKPLGAIELIPRRSFYDYKAKYTKSARTEHVMPARIKKEKFRTTNISG